MGNEAKNKSVPKLRFKEFEGKWNNYRLGDVCIKIQDGNYGESYPKSDEFVKEGIPFLTSKALGGDGILKEEKLDFLPVKKHNQLKKAHIELNDVLFTNRGSNVGTIGFVDKRIDGGNIGPQLTLLRSDLKIVAPLFLKVSLDTYNFKKQVNSQDSGSAMNFFGIRATSLFKLNLPSLPEQNKLAEFLSSVDKKIQLLEKKKEQLELYKKGVMQKIFSREIRFKDENGNSFPDWENLLLVDVLERTSTGLNPRKNFKLGSGDNYYITIKNIDNGKLDFDKAEKIDDLALKMIAKRSDLSKGDIIMSSIGNVGESFLLKEQPINWNINESVFMLRTNEKVSSNFLYHTLNLRNSRWYLENNSTGSSFKSIKLNDLKLMPLVVPSYNEQKKIADFLSAIDKKIETTSTQIDKTKEFKKGLLQQMFV